LPTSDSWTDVDATGLKIDLHTQGGSVEVWGSIPVNISTVGLGPIIVSIDFTYDGSRYANAVHSSPLGLAVYKGEPELAGARRTLHFGPVRVNLSAGQHTFKLQWYFYDTNGNTLTLYDVAIFGAREVNV
jgi:hypothetical protein